MDSQCLVLSKTVCFAAGKAFDVTRHGFPSVVRIETTNACNAKCIICPHSMIKRPIVQMDESLYVRLVDECAESGCRELHLHNFGEPLMDKRIFERIDYAKKKGIAKVKIFCNGSLLDRERAKKLIDAGLDEIKISMDGASKEEYERIRVPLQFDTVVRNITDIVELRNLLHSPLKIIVTCCSTSDKESTMQPFEKIVDGFSFTKIHNWGGTEEANGRGRVRKPCSRLWHNFTVLANGDVALCCLDYDGQFLLGHIDESTSIRDVWNNQTYNKVRSWHKKGIQDKIPLCSNCTKAFLY